MGMMSVMATKAAAAARFEGFPAEAFDFYEALADNNTRPWWNEHKPEYEKAVKGPLQALLDELADEFGAGKLFRPYNDTRFAKGKPPIKEHQGAVIELEDAVAYYVQVSAGGVMVAGGWYAPQGQQIHRFREAVDGPRGAELVRLVAAAEQKFEVDGRPLKTRPKGYEADNPRIDLLRFRALTVARSYPVDAALGTRKALTMVRNDWRAIRPLLEWLADNVGPGTDPADGT
jgi:uncharacterized protein (TIGR02453 family)